MESLCSTNNQHVGVDLKAAAIIMMDAFCCCSYVRVMLQGKKCLLMESSCLHVFIYSALSWLSWRCNHRDVQTPPPFLSHRYLPEECWPSLAECPQTDWWVCLPAETLCRVLWKCFWHLDADLSVTVKIQSPHTGINLSLNKIICWITHTMTTVHHLKMLP